MFSKEKWHCSDAFSRTAPIGFSHSGFSDFALNVYYVYQFSDLQIQLTTSPKPKPDDPDSVAFGHCFSDHMMEVSWSASSGWGKPQISPVHNLNLHPGAKCFHYATEVKYFLFFLEFFFLREALVSLPVFYHPCQKATTVVY